MSDREENNKPEIIQEINSNIMKFPYFPKMETAAGVHIGLNPFYIQMRQEVHNLHALQIKARRAKLRELFITDFLNENKELGEVRFGYINTQP